MITKLYGRDPRLYAARRALCEVPGNSAFHLLPIPSSPDGVTVGREHTDFSPLFAEIAEGDCVGGYCLPDAWVKKFGEVGAIAVDAAKDRLFLAENAELTADGVLAYLMTHGGRGISDLTVGIVGYGRIGSSLARKLLFFGAKPLIYTSSAVTRLTLGEMGIATEESLPASERECRLSGLEKLHFLVNTAPASLLGEADFACLKAVGAKILEVASGDNMPKGNCIRLPGLPAKLYPKTAGRLYADAVLRGYREVKP